MKKATQGSVKYYNMLRDVKIDEMVLNEIAWLKLTQLNLMYQVQMKIEEEEKYFVMPGPSVINLFTNQGEPVQPITTKTKPEKYRPVPFPSSFEVTMSIGDEQGVLS